MDVDLRSYTPARVALGRSGNSVPTGELLRFQLDHARARDAVHHPLHTHHLEFPHIVLRSAAPDRATYLRRPDMGRRLDSASAAHLTRGRFDAALVVADGLSALAVERHTGPLIAALLPQLEGWVLAPIAVVIQGRVAVGDEIGGRLGAEMVVVLIGERPGLTSPDSLGAYLTWSPRPGLTDAARNCVSNIRAEGLNYQVAAHKIAFLMRESRQRRLSGVALKEDAPLLLG